MPRSSLPPLALILILVAACDGTLPLADAGDGDGDGDLTDGGSLVDGGDPEPDPVELGCQTPGSLGDSSAVLTSHGPVRGFTQDGIAAFLGIPYAASPTGAFRFLPPQALECWEPELQFADYGHRCAQNDLSGNPSGNEDCLSLNVWTGADLTDEVDDDKPVLFWIHGGANVIGGSYEPANGQNLYDGKHFVREQDVVVVSANYRLGALGFLAHGTLNDEDDHGSSGNYGILDLIEALRWVKANARAFGGDPDRITIFGESAGALNTCVLMTSPLTEGLFSSALMQSGACEAPPQAERSAAGALLISDLGCAGADDVPACLRTLTVDQILAAAGDTPAVLNTWDLPFGPNVDGYVLTDEPMNVLEAGDQQPVPLVIGSNAHESELFLPPTITTCFDFDLYVDTLFGGAADSVKAEYDCFAYPFARYALVDVLTDVSFTCPARRIATASANAGHATWRYHYRYERADPQVSLLRAGHAMELAILFGTYGRTGYFPPASEDALSDRMMQAWADFADESAMSSVAGTLWAPYDPDLDNVLVFDDVIDTAEGVASDHCDFWDFVSP